MLAPSYRHYLVSCLMLISPQIISPATELQCDQAYKDLDLRFLPEETFEENSPSSVLMCRDRSGFSDVISFKKRSSVMCHAFLFLSRVFKSNYQLFSIDQNRLFMAKPLDFNVASNVSNGNNTLIDEDILNQIKIFDTLHMDSFNELCSDLPVDDCQRWQQCISESTECCRQQIKELCSINSPESANITKGCPHTWDGYSCWKAAEAGSTHQKNCPRFIKPTKLSATSEKKCTINGTWNKNKGIEWTNYTDCYDHSDLITAAYIVITINGISIFFLLSAILVYVYFRDLIRQDRVILHVNFFLALLLSSLSHLLWTCLVYLNKLKASNDVFTVAYKNPVWCRVINFMCIYFGGATYTWMFCEGFHLHRLISNAFVVPKSMAVLYCIGWIFPMVTSMVYACVRFFVDNQRCWMRQNGFYSWIIYIPNTVCIALNLIFLLNILRILFFQLQDQPNEPNSFRRGLKAGMMLVPLFGLQLAATAYRPDLEGEAEVYIQVLFDVLIHSQGIFVSLIFCFLSGEVLNQIKREMTNRCCKGLKTRAHLTTFTNTINSTDGVNESAIDDNDKGTNRKIFNKKYTKIGKIFNRRTSKNSEILKNSKENFEARKSQYTTLIQNSAEKVNEETLEMKNVTSKKDQS